MQIVQIVQLPRPWDTGGFGTLNDTVRQYLRRWFVSQMGVEVVSRVGNGNSRSGSSSNSRSNNIHAQTWSLDAHALLFYYPGDDPTIVGGEAVMEHGCCAMDYAAGNGGNGQV